MQTKQQQMALVYDWLNNIEAACELVITENDVSLIDPFELVSLVNVRLHMEMVKEKTPKVNPKENKTNLFILKPNNNDEN